MDAVHNYSQIVKKAQPIMQKLFGNGTTVEIANNGDLTVTITPPRGLRYSAYLAGLLAPLAGEGRELAIGIDPGDKGKTRVSGIRIYYPSATDPEEIYRQLKKPEVRKIVLNPASLLTMSVSDKMKKLFGDGASVDADFGTATVTITLSPGLPLSLKDVLEWSMQSCANQIAVDTSVSGITAIRLTGGRNKDKWQPIKEIYEKLADKNLDTVEIALGKRRLKSWQSLYSNAGSALSL